MPWESVSRSASKFGAWEWKFDCLIGTFSKMAPERLVGGFVTPGVCGGVGAGEERELPEKSSGGIEDCEREMWLNIGVGGSILSRAPRGET